MNILIKTPLDKFMLNSVSLLNLFTRGAAVICLTLALKPACAGVVVVECGVVLGQHKEIPVQGYLIVASDTERDYRLRQCAAYAYARTYPESFREFIKMLYASDGNARQIAEFALSSFGPSAKEAVPHLIGMFRDLRQGGLQALINIGVDDRGALDVLLNFALNERNGSAIDVLSAQESLPAYIGPLIISEIEKGERNDVHSLVHVLLPIKDDLSIDYFIQFQIDMFSNADWSSSTVNLWRKYKSFKGVGNIALRPLFKNFWGRSDVDSKALSLVMLMGLDSPEAKTLAQQLVKELIPILRADLLDAGLLKTDADRFLFVVEPAKGVGAVGQSTG